MKRNIQLLYFINFLSCFRFYTPVLVIYFAQITGSYTLAMTIVGMDSLFKAILEVPTGIYSDLIGRKKTLILALATSILTVVCWGIGGNFWILLLGTFFGGLSGALASGNNDALLYDSLKEINQEDRYHHSYARSSSFGLAGFGISALIGGFIATISFSLLFWISAVFFSVSLILAFWVHQPPSAKKVVTPFAHLKDAIHLFIHNPRLRLLSLSGAYSSAITETTYQFSPVFINTLWPIWAVGIMKSGTNFLNSFGRLLSGQLIEKFGALKNLAGSFIISRIVLIISYAFPTVLSPVIIAFASVPFGVQSVAQQSLLQKEFSDHQRATMASLDSLLGALLFTIASFLVGFVADLAGPRNLMLTGEIFLLPVLFLYWRLFTHHQSRVRS